MRLRVNVVFPEPVFPTMSKLRLVKTTRCRNSRMRCCFFNSNKSVSNGRSPSLASSTFENAPLASSSSKVLSVMLGLRIVMDTVFARHAGGITT